MSQDLRVTFHNLEKGIDWRNATVVSRPKASSVQASQASARALVSALGQTPAAATVRSIQELAGPPSGRLITAGSIGGVAMPSAVRDFTIALGPSFSANFASFCQGNVGAGVYWWLKPGLPDEMGLWGSVGISATTNIGFNGGGQISVWYGSAPIVMAGESMGVTVDVSIGAVTVSGMMFFSVPPGGLLMTPGMKHPPTFPAGWKPTLIGLGFGLGGGWSVFPTDISVGPSMTWLKPL